MLIKNTCHFKTQYMKDTKNGPKVGCRWYTWFSLTLYWFDILFLVYEQIIVTIFKLKLDQQSSKIGVGGVEDIGHHPYPDISN